MGARQGSLVHHFPSRKSVFNFPVKGKLPPQRATSAKICAKHTTDLSPSCYSWVPVDMCALLEDTDYTLEPTFLTDLTHTHGAMALPCIVYRASARLLVTNFTAEPFEIPSHTALGHATAFGPGMLATATAACFPLTPQLDGAGQPFDAFEFDEQPEADPDPRIVHPIHRLPLLSTHSATGARVALAK